MTVVFSTMTEIERNWDTKTLHTIQQPNSVSTSPRWKRFLYSCIVHRKTELFSEKYIFVFMIRTRLTKSGMHCLLKVTRLNKKKSNGSQWLLEFSHGGCRHPHHRPDDLWCNVSKALHSCPRNNMASSCRRLEHITLFSLELISDEK